MILKSYAKLNLTLSVNKKLKIGLHSIQSIYCLIDLYDKISVKKIKNVNSDKISLIKKEWIVEDFTVYNDIKIKNFYAGKKISWKIQN